MAQNTYLPNRPLKALLDFLVELLMAALPQDPVSMALKRVALRARGARIGQRPKVWRGVWIDDCQKFSVGNDVTIGHSVILICGGGVTVGDRAMIGHGAQIVSSGHRIPADRHEPMRWSGPEAKPISIGSDAWIGAGAILLPGVDVGEGAVVAAGAVVTKNVPPFVIVGGNPARLLRERT